MSTSDIAASRRRTLLLGLAAADCLGISNSDFPEESIAEDANRSCLRRQPVVEDPVTVRYRRQALELTELETGRTIVTRLSERQIYTARWSYLALRLMRYPDDEAFILAATQANDAIDRLHLGDDQVTWPPSF